MAALSVSALAGCFLGSVSHAKLWLRDPKIAIQVGRSRGENPPFSARYFRITACAPANVRLFPFPCDFTQCSLRRKLTLVVIVGIQLQQCLNCVAVSLNYFAAVSAR